MLLTEKHANDLQGVLSCYDRVIIHGNIAGWCFAEGTTGILASRGIRVFDFAAFSAPLTEAIRKNAEQIAQENGVEIEFIRKIGALRQDDRISEILSKRGQHPGLVTPVFSHGRL